MDEIDLQQKVWTIPANRMKARKPHRVPLSDRVAEIVAEMKRVAISDFVFPAAREFRPLADTTLSRAIATVDGGDFTVHGFRSSFRDWVSEETSFQREVAEAALAHTVGDAVEQAYRRGDALASVVS